MELLTPLDYSFYRVGYPQNVVIRFEPPDLVVSSLILRSSILVHG